MAAGSAAAAGSCLYVNNTLPHITTPTFAVQQMASIFDTQCNLAGQIYTLEQGVSAMLQVQCIVGRGSEWHECFQYSDKCSAADVHGVIAPFQQQCGLRQTFISLDPVTCPIGYLVKRHICLPEQVH